MPWTKSANLLTHGDHHTENLNTRVQMRIDGICIYVMQEILALTDGTMASLHVAHGAVEKDGAGAPPRSRHGRAAFALQRGG